VSAEKTGKSQKVSFYPYFECFLIIANENGNHREYAPHSRYDLLACGALLLKIKNVSSRFDIPVDKALPPLFFGF
jgi:hypothetical protein